jgi:CheY-like chemotaxis protein
VYNLRRILLVEDNPNDVELTLAALSESHLANEVVVVRDGAEALDYLRRRGPWADRPPENPVVVLLDLKMPKVDGIQVLREMKGDDRLRHLPVVMLTSSHEHKDLEECYRLGVNGYVVKPVVFSDFVETVRKLTVFWAITNEPPPGSLDHPR